VRSPVTRLLALGAAIALAYVAGAQVGFRLAFLAEQITTVWAPTGIALAALLLGGLRLWPAIWVGAFVANAGTSAPLWTAFVLATGNTAEAVAAVWALRAIPKFDITLRRVRDVLAFGAIAMLACTTISATVGVATLCAAGVQAWQRFGVLWFEWWFGDALGTIIVAPAILTVARHTWTPRELVRGAAFVGGSLLVTELIFGQRFGLSAHPLEYGIFPVAIAAAVTGGPPLTSLTVLSATILAIRHTVDGSGPFAGESIRQGLMLLQVFLGVLSGTALLLAASVAERRETERLARQAAQVLRHRDEMLLLAQRAGGVATFEYDYRNQVAHCSPELFRIFGLPHRDGTMTTVEWQQFVHPDDRERMARHVAASVVGAEPAAADYRIITPDGSTRWLTYTGQMQHTPDGDRLFGTVVDITERKRLEADLRHHVAEVERILETIGEGFVALDREFRYVYVNQAAEQMLGRRRADLLGRVPWQASGGDTIAESREQLESASRLGLPRRFEMHVAGANRWYENRVYPSADGLSIFFADVTAPVEAAAALLESQDVLSLAMRGGSMGAWSRNMKTNEVWWSRELEEIVGLQPGTFSRTEAAFLELVHDEDRAAVRTAIDEAVERASDYVVEFRFKHTSGEWRWMEGRGRAVYGDDGAARTLYGIGIDVTARKHAEMALREAKVAAESANELKDHFLATLSHELRTPLNVILGYARLLQTHSVAAEDQQRAFDVIARNAVAQNQLVDDLLDMSRITTGKFRLDPRPIPVVTVLHDALEGVKPAADAKNITLDVDIDPLAGTVAADPTRLQQVFWNLLANAAKFTPKGGRISVSLARDGAHVQVVIRDNGPGISPEFLPFVFEPFRQAGAGFDRAHGGLGLGLAISRQLVELHGGTIQAASAGLGLGAAFTIRLPRVDEQTIDDIRLRGAPDEARSGAAQASLTGVNILLVDDEPDTLTLFRKALEDAGAQVRAVASGVDALREVESWRPDLLVTDLGLPGMDGYELFRALSATRTGRTLPAVAVSAYARPDDRTRALAAGFIAHVAKPIDPLSLVRTLTTTLSPTD
jgi:PAS domain S-box-containing protein